jgi:hypothetical protein
LRGSTLLAQRFGASVTWSLRNRNIEKIAFIIKTGVRTSENLFTKSIARLVQLLSPAAFASALVSLLREGTEFDR